MNVRALRTRIEVRRAPWLAALVACVACVNTTTATVAPSVDAEPNSVERSPSIVQREDPWIGFAAAINDAARAMNAAALGTPYDEKWQCADAKTDIRATDARAKATFTSKGTPDYLLTVLENITLTSPLDSSAVAEEAPDDTSEPHARATPTVILRGNAFVFGDGRVRWFEMTGRSSSTSSSGTTSGTRLKRLPSELRGAMSDLITTLTSTCVLPFADGADLAPLPLPAEKKDSALETIEHHQAELPHACEAAARASGPWDVRFARMTSAYRVADELAILNTELRVIEGRLCLGRVTAETL